MSKCCLKSAGDDAPGEGGGTTSSKKIEFEDRILRDCATNCVAMRVALLSDDDNRCKMTMVYHVTQPILKHDTAFRRDTKDSDSCEKWLTKMVCGGVMEYIKETVSVTKSPAAMADVKLSTTEREAGQVSKLGDGPVGEEDAKAEEFGTLAWTAATQVLRRELHLLIGYPWSATRMLGSEEWQDDFVADFKKDISVSRKVALVERKKDGLATLSKRSLFRKTTVEQLVAAFEDTRPSASTTSRPSNLPTSCQPCCHRHHCCPWRRCHPKRRRP